MALGLVLLVSPLVYEGGQVVLAKWQTMAGNYRVPETPILDALGEWSRTGNQEVKLRYSRLLNRGAWKPTTAVPIAIIWATLMAVVFLRRVR
jgi:hypothetical protein